MKKTDIVHMLSHHTHKLISFMPVRTAHPAPIFIKFTNPPTKLHLEPLRLILPYLNKCTINQSAPAQNAIYNKQIMQKMLAKFHSCPEIKYAFECTYFKITAAQ
jgi:hypothetical protein